MKINWDDITTNIVKYGLIGIFALGLHLISTNAIDGHDNHEKRIAKLEQHHNEGLIPPKKEPFNKKLWNWITFKEFRR